MFRICVWIIIHQNKRRNIVHLLSKFDIIEIPLDSSNDNNNNTKIKSNCKSSNSLKDIVWRELGQNEKLFWLIIYNLKTKKWINPKLYMITTWPILLKLKNFDKKNLSHFHGNETIPSCVAAFHFSRWLEQSETGINREIKTPVMENTKNQHLNNKNWTNIRVP